MTCPNKSELLEWYQGLMSDDREHRLSKHISGCDVCEKILQTVDQQAVVTLNVDIQVTAEHEPELERMLTEIQQASQKPVRAAFESNVPSTGPMSGSKFRDYRVLHLLGRGGMGEVYAAKHTHLDRSVAIKFLAGRERVDQETKDANLRFFREMKSLGRLQHPNVLQAFDAGEHDGCPFLVTEYLNGIDVEQYAAEKRVLPIATACEIVRQAAVGLAYAHKQQLVHRDIKPSNLMLVKGVDETTTVKLLDMGLARFVRQPSDDQLTGAGQLMGTLDYLPPEQASADGSVGQWSDIYSLGATLFRLITGHVVLHDHQDHHPARKLDRILHAQRPRLRDDFPDIPERLDSLVTRMLSLNNVQRPTCSEVADELTEFSQCIPWQEIESLLDDVGLDQEIKNATQTVSFDDSDIGSGRSSSADVETLIDSEASLKAKPVTSGAGNRGAVRVLWLCAGFGMAAMAAAVFWVLTDGGYLEVESDVDVDIEIVKLENSTGLSVGRHGKQQWLRAGRYEFRLPSDRQDILTLDKKSATISRGDKVVLRVRKVSKQERERQAASMTRKVADADSSQDSGKQPQDADAPAVSMRNQSALSLSTDVAHLILANGGFVLDRSGTMITTASQVEEYKIRPVEVEIHASSADQLHKILRPLSQLKTLRKLDLVACPFDEESLDMLSEFDSVINLGISTQLLNDQNCEALFSLELLEVLVLDETQMTPDGYRRLFSKLPHLKHLTLNSLPVSLQDLGAALAASSVQEVHAFVSPSESLSSLRESKINALRIDAASWCKDSADVLATMPRLKFLSLVRIKDLTDADLAALRNLQSLIELELMTTPKITVQGIVNFLEQNSECRMGLAKRFLQEPALKDHRRIIFREE